MEKTLFRRTDDTKRTGSNIVKKQLAQRLQMPHTKEAALLRRRLDTKGADYNMVKHPFVDKPQISPILEKTFHPRALDIKEADGNTYIVRLKRNNKTLLRLRRELDSYLYEPRTCTLFDRIVVLKDRMESVLTKNTEIVGFLKHHRQSVGDYLDFIKFAFRNFNDLKFDIEAYMCDAHFGRPVS